MRRFRKSPAAARSAILVESDCRVFEYREGNCRRLQGRDVLAVPKLLHGHGLQLHSTALRRTNRILHKPVVSARAKIGSCASSRHGAHQDTCADSGQATEREESHVSFAALKTAPFCFMASETVPVCKRMPLAVRPHFERYSTLVWGSRPGNPQGVCALRAGSAAVVAAPKWTQHSRVRDGANFSDRV